jgi:formylglycine-generating enzyme required for sulfatase activity
VSTWIRAFLIAAAAALCFPDSAAAQKRVALVVANWSYVNADLPNPKYDADLVMASLKKAGFTVIPALNVNLNDFEAAIDKFVYESQGAEVALFYFAGHGFSTSDDSRSHWLLATDTDFAAKNPYVLHSHADSLERIQARIVGNATYTLVFVDACRNSLGPAQGQRGAGQRGFEPFDAAIFKRSLVVVSTGEGSTAADGTPGMGSPFARAFASILPTPGQRIDDAYRAIRDAVSVETNGNQVPEVVRDDLPSGTLTLVKAAGGNPEVDPGGGGVVTNMHLEVAREAWGYLQYSTNAEELKSFASLYKDTEFGALASARATTVSPSSPEGVEQNAIKTAERGRPGPPGGSPSSAIASLEATTPAVSTPALPQAPSPVPVVQPVAAAISIGPPPKISAKDPGGEVFKECDECPEMVVVPAGKAMLGSPPGESGRQTFEAAPHAIEIARPFAVGRYAVTFTQWDACYAEGGCGHRRLGDLDFGRGKRPAIFVSWTEAQLYVQWLKRQTGQPYRLLSEAEWEYAARGCKNLKCANAPFWFGAINPELAVYDSRRSYEGSPKADPRMETEPVDSGPANPFGLYNMLGNVRQWTQDCWNPAPSAVASNGAPVLSGDCSARATRGGSWADEPAKLRAASRGYESVDEGSERIGFRVARDLEP